MAESDTSTADDAAAVGDEPTVGGIAYRWVAMGVVLFGTFMVVLDTTVVNLGLPAMQEDFGTVEGIEWVVTAYLASVGVTQMATGWIADRFGRKSAFVFALVLFTSASLLCAASFSLEMLIFARVLQGVGGGLLMPVAMAMIYELFEPDERGRALGFFGIAVMAAPAIGPVLGGSLVSSLGWHWLFLINAPIGLVGIPVAIKFLRDTGFREARRFDRTGLVLSGFGIALLLIGFERGGQHGWSELSVWLMIGVAAVLLTAFVFHVLRVDQPLVDLRIFTHPVFAIGMVSVALVAVAQYSRLVYIPLELGTLRGISEFRIGLVMLPSALGIAMTMPLGGRLTDRVGARLPVSIGVLVLLLSFIGLVSLTVDTHLWKVSAILFAGGLGSGLSMMAPNIVAMNSVSASQVSQGSGLSSVTRQVSAAIGVSILAALFATTRPDLAPDAALSSEMLLPYRSVFTASIVLLSIALVVAQFLPGKRRALELQAERRAELDAMSGTATTADTDAAATAAIH